MDRKYWILVDEDGFQHVESADDMDELYDICDYFIQTAIKLDSHTIETLIKKVLKSKMDGSVDTSYEWCEAIRRIIKALEQNNG